MFFFRLRVSGSTWIYKRILRYEKTMFFLVGSRNWGVCGDESRSYGRLGKPKELPHISRRRYHWIHEGAGETLPPQTVRTQSAHAVVASPEALSTSLTVTSNCFGTKKSLLADRGCVWRGTLWHQNPINIIKFSRWWTPEWSRMSRTILGFWMYWYIGTLVLR